MTLRFDPRTGAEERTSGGGSRVLIWSPNYAPELTGIPPLVTDASDWLAAQGHDVDVVTAMPNYPERRIRDEYRGALWRHERRGAVDVHRSWLRVRPQEGFRDKALYELSFAAWSSPLAASRIARADVVVAVVPTLVSSVLAAGLVRALGTIGRRPRFVLWFQDLVVPAALSLDKLGAPERGALGLAARAERYAARSADRIVVCSPGFKDYLVARGVDEDRIEVVYNWVDAGVVTPGPVPEPKAGGQRTKCARFLYAGNLGYTQGFETLVEAARLVPSRVELDIVGDGNAAGHVRELAASMSNVRVAPPVAATEFPNLLASAHAHVLVQRRVASGANLPSKINSYLASGRPVVAAIDPHAPGATLLRQSGGALLVPPESPATLARAMVRLARRPDLRDELGRRGRDFAVRNLDKRHALPRLEGALLG